MANKKDKSKKEPVKLRFKKLADGRESIYLDIYYKGVRSYKFLKLYIVHEPGNAAKAANKNAMLEAERQLQEISAKIRNGEALNDEQRESVSIIRFFDDVMAEKEMRGKRLGNMLSTTRNHIEAYKGEDVALEQINAAYVRGFLRYLDTITMKNGKRLSETTKKNYFRCLCLVLNVAVRRGFLVSSPANELETDERPKAPESKRQYLDVSEVKAMAATCDSEDPIKWAFLFSCFCGLRYSDVKALTWGHVANDGGKWRVDVTMQKTGGRIVLPLSSEAVRWLPERDGAKDNDPVFVLPSVNTVERALASWAQGCGIEKHVTFHVARHTFATLCRTAGADLHTTSKLLGHADISTTQVYAKIIDSKKDEAVDAVSSLFG